MGLQLDPELAKGVIAENSKPLSSAGYCIVAIVARSRKCAREPWETAKPRLLDRVPEVYSIYIRNLDCMVHCARWHGRAIFPRSGYRDLIDRWFGLNIPAR